MIRSVVFLMSVWMCFCFISAGDSKSLPRRNSKEGDGQSSPVSSRMGRSSVSPTMMLSGGGGDCCNALKTDLLNLQWIRVEGSRPKRDSLQAQIGLVYYVFRSK